MSKIYIGIDNGVTGTIGVVGGGCAPSSYVMPTKKCLNYTKTKQFISRIDVEELAKILAHYDIVKPAIAMYPPHVLLERPLDTPVRYKATKSAMRALEAVLIVIEQFDYSYEYVDSRQWQKIMLPSDKDGDTKTLSLLVGKQLFPHLNFKRDADGILMAEWARRVGR